MKSSLEMGHELNHKISGVAALRVIWMSLRHPSSFPGWKSSGKLITLLIGLHLGMWLSR